MKKLFVKTYGCQMNAYDFRQDGGSAGAAGLCRTECCRRRRHGDPQHLSHRERAAEKVYSELGRLKAFESRQGASRRAHGVGVAGCVAQAEGAEIVGAPARGSIWWSGRNPYHRLPEMIARARAKQGHVWRRIFPVGEI